MSCDAKSYMATLSTDRNLHVNVRNDNPAYVREIMVFVQMPRSLLEI